MQHAHYIDIAARRHLPDSSAVPPELANRPRWIPYRRTDSPAGGRTRKVPVCPRTGRPADPHAVRNLSPLAVALAAADRLGADGVGYSLAAGGGVTAVDIDGCVDPDTHAVTATASDILDRLRGTYAETSPSGRGLRLFAGGDLDPLGRRRARVPGLGWGGGPASLELYDSRQFVSVTGDRLPGRPAALADHASALWALQRSLGLPRPAVVARPAAGDGFSGSYSALLVRAFAAKNGAATRRLWAGDHATYTSASEALLGLAQRFAFWTGPDAGRLFDLLTDSPLVAATEATREKWHSPRPGGPWGLVYAAAKAVATCRSYHPGGVSRTPDPAPGPTPRPPPCKTLSSSLIAKNDDQPLGSPSLSAAVAWARAGNAAPGRGTGDVLAAVCYRLSAVSPGGVFFLSARTAGEAVGVSHAAAAVRIKAMVAGGTLAVAENGEQRPGGRATRYRWAGSSETPCPKE